MDSAATSASSRLAAHLRTARPIAYFNVQSLAPRPGQRVLWERNASQLGFLLSPRAMVCEAPSEDWRRYYEALLGERLEPWVAPEAFGASPRPKAAARAPYFPLARTSAFDHTFPNSDTFLSRWPDGALARCFDKTILPDVFGARNVVPALRLDEVRGRDRLEVCEGVETREVLLRGPATIQGRNILRVKLSRLREVGPVGLCAHPALGGAAPEDVRVHPFVPDEVVDAHLEAVVSVVDGALDFVQPLAQVTRHERKYGVRTVDLHAAAAANVAGAARQAAAYVIGAGVRTCVLGFDGALLRDGRLLVYDLNPCVTQGLGPLLAAARLGAAAFRSALLVVDRPLPFDVLREAVTGRGAETVVLGYFSDERAGHTSFFLNVHADDAAACERGYQGCVAELSRAAQVVPLYH